jgi:UDP-N-acetyl-2-amino-2-deoxyglucuronate dehydrogenase
MADTLRLALVGCGAICDWHQVGIRTVPEIEITAAVDVDRARAEAAAAKFGAEVFTSLDEALAKGTFDSVDLMLPHDVHEAAAVECFAAGKNVLLEKPMATTVDACKRILAAAGHAKTVFMLAENAQYWPEILIAREQIENGAIGDTITAQVHLFFPVLEAFYGGDRPWRMRKVQTGGGICIDAGSHYIRPLRMWMGEIDEVVAAMERPCLRMEGESLARALFRFRSGRVASFDLMLAEAPVGRQDVFRITGTKGEILIGLMHVTLYNQENPDGVQVGANVPQGYFLSYEGQFRDFASAVLHGTQLAASAEFAVGELRTALAMERSAETKRWEKVWA